MPAFAATGDPIPASAKVQVLLDTPFTSTAALANYYPGLGIWAPSPATRLHIGNGDLQAAANGNYLNWGVNPFQVVARRLR